MLEPSRKSRQMQSCCNRAAIVFRRSSSYQDTHLSCIQPQKHFAEQKQKMFLDLSACFLHKVCYLCTCQYLWLLQSSEGQDDSNSKKDQIPDVILWESFDPEQHELNQSMEASKSVRGTKRKLGGRGNEVAEEGRKRKLEDRGDQHAEKGR